jgi:membrane protease YdiL (CAAX protease family)
VCVHLGLIMSSEPPVLANPDTISRRHPVLTYFALTFALSWMGALAVAAPNLIHDEPLPKMTGILMFPAMLLGPTFAGIVLTRIVDGKSGLRVLFSQMCRAWVLPRWYTALLLPPALVLTVLLLLERFASPVYAPNRFFMGILFGIPAGFLEEIGWMGYAFPKMRSETNGLAPSILLGLLWSLWHLPVINYLGNHTTWWLLAAIFSCVQLDDDSHASADRVDLYEHEKRVVGAAHACKFDKLPCRFQRSTRDSRARSDVVCPVRNCSLDCRRNRCQDIRPTSRNSIRLTFDGSAPFQRLGRDSGRMVGTRKQS